jgi:hypothetical protein
MPKPCTYVTSCQRCWTFQGWRGAPLVVSPAEGAARRSVTVCRDRPAPQPLREQEQVRAADATVAGSVHRGPAGFTIRGLDRLRLAESCQPGRCLYASVSQERRNRLELRESPFTPRSDGVLRGKAALQHASVHSAGVFKSAAGNSSIPIGQPAYL